MRNIPLKFLYSTLYDYCSDKQATVADNYDEENWDIGFNRSFSDGDLETYNNLVQDLSQINLDESNRDEVSWLLDSKGIFTTQSLYRFITNGGVVSHIDNCIWGCKLPLKIKVFLWQMHHGKLQVSAVLSRRGWKGDRKCALCGDIKTIDHIFFKCPLEIFCMVLYQGRPGMGRLLYFGC